MTNRTRGTARASAKGSRQDVVEQARGAADVVLGRDPIVRGRDDSELSEAQLAALAAIDRQLATMSRLAAELDADMWSEAALKHDETWVQIRQLSAVALEAFGWAEEPS